MCPQVCAAINKLCTTLPPCANVPRNILLNPLPHRRLCRKHLHHVLTSILMTREGCAHATRAPRLPPAENIHNTAIVSVSSSGGSSSRTVAAV
jgi:hypothetical protein